MFQRCALCVTREPLCSACLHNQAAIQQLEEQLDEVVRKERLYDLCARAFGTTRDDAKKRLVGAMYGVKQTRLPSSEQPTLIGWTWKTHLESLHDDVTAGRWLRATKTLALMLRYALDELEKKVPS